MYKKRVVKPVWKFIHVLQINFSYFSFLEHFIHSIFRFTKLISRKVLSMILSASRSSFHFVVHPSSAYLFTVGVEGFWFHLITLKHTPQSVGLFWRRDRPVAETSTWQHKHYTGQTSMPPVWFEPTIPTSARPQNYALSRSYAVSSLQTSYQKRRS
jgi:hypothetical protein